MPSCQLRRAWRTLGDQVDLVASYSLLSKHILPR